MKFHSTGYKPYRSRHMRTRLILIIIAAVIVIAAIAIIAVGVTAGSGSKTGADSSGTEDSGGTTDIQSDFVIPPMVTEIVTEPETEPVTEEQTQPETEPETTPPHTNGPSSRTKAPSLDGKTLPEAPEGFFSDSLFIGDSRTVGINTYGGLDEADFFATQGMNVYHVWKEKVSVPQMGKITLDTLLAGRTYGKIYVMLGINELGYDLDNTIRKYGDLINSIREKQPGAIIYICANLHITKSRSDTDSIYNNRRIDYLNEGMAAFADGSNIRYIDVNELFDDSTGSLRTDCASDYAHVLGRFYALWRDWIYTKST